MLQVIKHILEHLYQINRSSDSFALVLSKNIPFHKKVEKKSALNEKSIFLQKNYWSEKKLKLLAFSHFNNFFVTHGHITAIINLLYLILSELSYSQSPQHSKTYLQSLKIKPETRFILWQSSGNQFHFSQKGQHFVIFRDLTLSDGKNKIKNPIFFFRDSEICMS